MRVQDPDGTRWLSAKFKGYEEPEWIKDTQLVDGEAANFEERRPENWLTRECIGQVYVEAGREHPYGQLSALEGQVEVGMTIRKHYGQLMKTPEADQWKAAADEEVKTFKELGIFKMMKRQQGQQPIGNRWTAAVKGDGRKKMRLVGRGDQQQCRINYDKTFSGTPSATAFRITIALVATMNFLLFSHDVKSAFLKGKPEEGLEICTEIPEGWTDPSFGKGGTDWRSARKTHVLKVVGNWYGMKQAGRIWGLEAAKVKQKLGWTQSQIEGCVFFDKGAQIDQKVKDSQGAIDFERKVLAKGKLASIVCLWVDDGIGGVRQEPHALKVHLKRMKQMDATWGIKLEGSGLHRMQSGEERAHPNNVKDFEGTFAQGQEQIECSAIHLSIEVRKKGGRISISCEKFLRKVLERVGYGTQLGGKGRPVKTPFPQGGSKFGAEKDEPNCISKERDFHRSTAPCRRQIAPQLGRGRI